MARELNGASNKIQRSSTVSSVVDNFTIGVFASFSEYVDNALLIYNGNSGGAPAPSGGCGLRVSEIPKEMKILVGGIAVDGGGIYNTIDEFVFWCVRRINGLLQVFKDGVAFGPTITNTPGTTVNFFHIGDRNGSTGENNKLQAAHGFLVESALSTTIMKAIARGSNPLITLKQFTLKNYWPLDGNQSPEPDYSGNDNHGVLTGTTKAATNPPVQLLSRYL